MSKIPDEKKIKYTSRMVILPGTLLHFQIIISKIYFSLTNYLEPGIPIKKSSKLCMRSGTCPSCVKNPASCPLIPFMFGFPSGFRQTR